MGKGVLNVKAFHTALTKTDKKYLLEAYENAKAKYGDKLAKIGQLDLGQLINNCEGEYDDWDSGYYDNDCQGLPFTCSMSELGTPMDKNNLAKDILKALWLDQKALVCNTTSPNSFLDEMGFKLGMVFMGNHKKYVYSYQLQLDNLVI